MSGQAQTGERAPSGDSAAEPADRPAPVAFRPLRPTAPLCIPLSGNFKPEEIVPKPPGTIVARGESLAEKYPDSATAPLAPVAGRIVGIGSAKISSRLTVPGIFLEPDPNVPAPPPIVCADAGAIPAMIRRLSQIGLAAGIERMRSAGIWAERWTTPDLLGQLRNCLRKPVDIILCDALDETPELLLHHRVAATWPVELTAGVLALAVLTNAARASAVLAAYGDAGAWDAMRRATANTRLKLAPLADHYPQSHPSLLIHELTGRHSRPARLPAESGALVIGAPAAVAIGRCFLKDEPMLDVPMGLHDRSRGKTHWLSVPVGMAWSAVLSELSISSPGLELRCGNPLREVKVSTDCIISGGDLSVTAAPFQRYINPDPCIRCAWCVEGCPVSIQPAGLLEAAQQDDPFLAEQYGLDACIECGICSYVCPSHLPILQGIRKLREK
ncbi:MAG TPA: 4Fe-4S dicluster domain-containing protein [Tepidisphaeraceae bacterium]|jgi:electron transport complex protein RnfC|nr:4Fe-4S dicluster domain-containing protein [Tepidisphaeraceae bacterium]